MEGKLVRIDSKRICFLREADEAYEHTDYQLGQAKAWTLSGTARLK